MVKGKINLEKSTKQKKNKIQTKNKYKSKANNKPGRHKDKGSKYRLNFRKGQDTDESHRADEEKTDSLTKRNGTTRTDRTSNCNRK